MRKKILVISNEKSQFNLFNILLSAEGFLVLFAEDGQSGLAMCQTESPDLIIMDAILPKMSGYVFINLLRKDESLVQTPVLLLTSSRPVSTGIVFQTPTPYQLQKPIQPEKLIQMVWEILG